jgi:hypothetical protein
MNRKHHRASPTRGQPALAPAAQRQPAAPAPEALAAAPMQADAAAPPQAVPASDHAPRLQPQRAFVAGLVRSPAMVAQRSRLAAAGLAPGGVMQRLSLQNTDWPKVTAMKGSAGGAGGVLFVGDGSSKGLVVKPGVPADEELAASHAHKQVSGKGGLGQWEVKSLGTRMAAGHDVAGIRIARDRVEKKLGAPLDARATTLIGQLAAGTTMIQEAAQDSESLADAMREQSPKGHITPGEERTGSSKDKVKSDSPLKPLMKDRSNFARSLGRVAATDLLLGNFDRIVGAANLENMLLNDNAKVLQPIDNTGGTAVARLLTGGGGTVASAGWTGHPLAAMFIAKDYAGIADEVWQRNPANDMTMTSMQSELLDGFEGPVGNREYNVGNAEKTAVEAKLANHIDHIKAAFADGLRRGRDELVKGGPIPTNSGVSQAAREQYAARLALI